MTKKTKFADKATLIAKATQDVANAIKSAETGAATALQKVSAVLARAIPAKSVVDESTAAAFAKAVTIALGYPEIKTKANDPRAYQIFANTKSRIKALTLAYDQLPAIADKLAAAGSCDMQKAADVVRDMRKGMKITDAIAKHARIRSGAGRTELKGAQAVKAMEGSLVRAYHLACKGTPTSKKFASTLKGFMTRNGIKIPEKKTS